MDNQFEPKTRALLCNFESAYSNLLEEYASIKQYVEKDGGDIKSLIQDIKKSCDYFSLASPLLFFYEETKK